MMTGGFDYLKREKEEAERRKNGLCGMRTDDRSEFSRTGERWKPN